MKKLVWVAAAVLAFAIFFPNGVTLPVTKPVVPPVPVPVPVAVDVSPKIVEILATATPEDKNHIAATYDAMARVLKRDKGVRIRTTEKWADYQANTLQLAIETPGKYPGLDVAIEAVFAAQVGSDDVAPTDEATQQKLLKSCEIIAASARK